MAAETSAGIATILRNQFAFYFANYIVVLPLASAVFVVGVLEWRLAAAFYALAVLEHLCQELYRAMVMISWPLRATVTLFVRGGLWVVPTLAVLYANEDLRRLDVVLSVWLFFDLIALGLSIYLLRSLDWRAGSVAPVDWAWIRRGLRVALPLLAGTLTLRGIVTVDRYTIEHFSTMDVVGVYTFFAGLANTVPLLMETAVFMLAYPRIVAEYQRGNFEQYAVLARALGRRALVVLAPTIVLAALLVFPVLAIVGREVYAEHVGTYWTLLAGAAIWTLGMIPHTLLYARGKDHQIILSNAAGCATAVVLNLALVPPLADLGAAVATLGAFAAVAGLKALYSARAATDPARSRIPSGAAERRTADAP